MNRIFHIVSNKEWGGGEQYVLDLAQRQRTDGMDVSIVCKPIESIISKYKETGLAVQPLHLGGAADVLSARRLASMISKAGPCAIHAHNFKDAFTAAYARRLSSNKDVRVVMCRHLTRKGKKGLLYRWLYGQLDCLVLDSKVSYDMFLSTRPSIDHKKLRIVHTSIVSPGRVDAAPLREEFHIPEGCTIAMYHGRLDPEKGLDTLLEAAAMLRDCQFRLVLIGRGSEEYTGHLQKVIADKQITEKVVLAGFRHPVLPCVAAADFGILASTVREGCPLSPLEYMSQGHPVIATNNGGQREYITTEKNGLLVPPGDARQLADAMRRFIEDRGLRLRLGQQAKEDFDYHLSYEHFYTRIKQIYHE